MAKVTLNQLLEILQGGIGGLVFRQMPDGTIIISGAPRHNKRKTTKKQKAHRERFREAAKTARWLARQHPIYAELAKGTWKSPYNFSLSDWWHAPVTIASSGETGISAWRRQTMSRWQECG